MFYTASYISQHIGRSELSPVEEPYLTYLQCTAALVMFGLPKSFPIVWDQYRRYLIDSNPHINFEVSMHLYSDLKYLTNAKNNEMAVKIESADSLKQALGRNDTDFLVQTSQGEFDKQRLSWLEELHATVFQDCWSFSTIKNMFRQGNSIKESYKHAMSKQLNYSVFVFARTDTFLAKPVSIPCNIPPNQIQLPSWQVDTDYEDNDRFAVAGPEAADVYVQAKAEAFLDYVKNPDRVPRSSPRNQTNNWNSEHLLWLWMKENPRIDKKTKPVDWAPLLRIRGDAKVNSRDSQYFPLGWLYFKLLALKSWNISGVSATAMTKTIATMTR